MLLMNCGRICLPYKIQDVNLKVFSMIKVIKESKTVAYHISFECKCESNGWKCKSREKWKKDKHECKDKKLIKHRTCEEEYAWSPSTCACECDKDCEIGEYLKDCEFVESLVDDLVVTCDDVENTPESAVISPINGRNYWLLAVVILYTIVGTQGCEVLHET